MNYFVYQIFDPLIKSEIVQHWVTVDFELELVDAVASLVIDDCLLVVRAAETHQTVVM